MYNLFISGQDDAWSGEPFQLEIGRCVREYTDDDITNEFGELSRKNISQVKKFPCIFAYEDFCQKDPKIGYLKSITSRRNRVRIEYEIIKTKDFLKHTDLPDLLFELDIGKWELNRTHWAIKNVDLARELKRLDIDLPELKKDVPSTVDVRNHIFDVALSFPGEIREFVEQIVVELERDLGPNTYFYDENYTAQLARPSLDVLLQDIYRIRSNLVVVFIGDRYQKKDWCGVEYRAIREMMHKREHDSIMLVKMDDGKVDGVFEIDGYIDSNKYTPKEIAQFICERTEFQ